MADVRRNIDALDERIVPLVAERSAYVAQAARIKQSADHIVDRRASNSSSTACAHRPAAAGAPEAIVEAAYRAMIAASIDFERGEFNACARRPES
jgi:isochorismate pyruvate lyase